MIGDPRIDGGGGAWEPNLAAADGDRAAVGADGAAEDLNERALARAVLAAEGVDLAPVQFEVDPL